MKKGVILLIIVMCIFTLISGCGPASTSKVENDTANINGASSQSTSNKKEKITLTMWDLRTEGIPAEMIDKIISEFTKKNPNIAIKRTAFKADDLRNTIKPALNSGKGPDVFSYDLGPGYLGVLAKAGLAVDLTTYADQYGWNERFHDWALERGMYNGKLYGVPNELELLGVFYNKKLFKDFGVEPPKTYDEFLEICKKFKEKGVIPIIIDDKEQWPGFHLESIWLNSFVGPAKVKEAIANKAPWNRPEFGVAMDKLYEIVKMGYTNESPLGISYDDANKLFFSGKGAMRPTGTWLVGTASENMKEDVGFFYLPPANGDIPYSAPGGLGEAVVVSAKSKNIDAAVEFVDFMFSKEMIKIWYEAGYIPPIKNVDYSTFNLTPLFRDILDLISNASTLGENIDVLMPPKVNDVTKNYVQELIAGKKSGQECMDIKQKAFEEEISAGNYYTP